MSKKTKYEGTFIIEGRYKSKVFGQWSQWMNCASRGTENSARREMSNLVAEKTSVEQEFRLLHPCGTIIEERNNAENVLRG